MGDYEKREIGAIEKNYGAVSTPMVQGFEWEDSNEIMEGIDPKKYNFVEVPDMHSKNHANRPIIVGHDAINLHKDDEYLLRFPIKFGAFNVSHSYHLMQCAEDF